MLHGAIQSRRLSGQRRDLIIAPESPYKRRKRAGHLAPALLPALFTGVRGIVILRTSPFGHSQNFALTAF